MGEEKKENTRSISVVMNSNYGRNRGKAHREQRTKPRQTEMQSMSSYPYQKLITEWSDEETYEQDGGLKVYIYKSEFNKIREWVLHYKNIETGGDLFGLWVDAHTAVVQCSGKKSRRGKTSFFQDVDYLGMAGGYLTGKHGLCNIGQWHSHHQLSLNQPSTGDENTVWGNMPGLKMNRYIVCIANILKERNNFKTTLNCFLFEMEKNGEKLPILHGKFEHLNGESPVRKQPEIARVTKQGGEEPPDSDAGDYEDGFLARCWSALMKWTCSHQGKACIILALLSIPFIVFVVLYLSTE